ncbi:hypothetical protein I0C86_23495 [Plantactinospora sp. S1510]|uniref:Uncharacterized protein n=1 Tax=Plantactinospora alkalitolerans TaxID=2789879 RepID=A0ABS0H0D3_9ACTN|nr:hypothetical protein [Plantactinospora alkalitolerans]MBF9131905.1 hypothetical protein [Plantactinospora alkalitolerans]
MPTIQIRSGRHPFQTTLLVATFACGIAQLIVDARPRSVTTSMPILVQNVWEWGLVVVGIVGLLGTTWRGRLSTGLGIELGAMVVLGTTTGMYAFALFAVSGKAALTAGTFIAAIAVASGWRAVEILSDLRDLAGPARPAAAGQPPVRIERDPS